MWHFNSSSQHDYAEFYSKRFDICSILALCVPDMWPAPFLLLQLNPFAALAPWQCKCGPLDVRGSGMVGLTNTSVNIKHFYISVVIFSSAHVLSEWRCVALLCLNAVWMLEVKGRCTLVVRSFTERSWQGAWLFSAVHVEEALYAKEQCRLCLWAVLCLSHSLISRFSVFIVDVQIMCGWLRRHWISSDRRAH